MNFSQIEFGYASSEMELAQAPQLMSDAYIDLDSMTKEAIHGQKFLFLGYKGSGKSGICAHAQLLADRDEHLFVKRLSLADFPYSQLSKIVRGDSEPESKYPIAWSLLILPYIFDSLSRDHGHSLQADTRFIDFLSALEAAGLRATENPAKLVRVGSQKQFGITLPVIGGGVSFSSSNQRAATSVPDFVESAKIMLSSVRSQSKHVLFIDGLDEVLTAREAQFRSLGALVGHASELNMYFRLHSSPIKIIILCRTDLFELLAAPNKNKIRQDSSHSIDWFRDPNNSDNPPLVDVINQRARLGITTPSIDVFNTIFPERIDGINTVNYLLEFTRHTPRDFVMLVKNIQKATKNQSLTGKLGKNAIMEGLKLYSLDYFLPEIKDELVGYADALEQAELFRLLGTLRKRDFSFSTFTDFAARSGSRLTRERLYSLMQVLFSCSAIGNVSNFRGKNFYTFKFRNRNSTLNESDLIMLHRGLWKALNVG